MRPGFLLAASLVLSACTSPLYEDAACVDGEALTLSLWQRKEPTVIQDGSQVPVFPPPQGGVFTEIDVSIGGAAVTSLGALELTITRQDGRALASAAYTGEEIPYGCRDDGMVVVEDVPVGFADGTVLEELEGVEAELAASVEGASATSTVVYGVVLRVTDYGPIPPPQ